MLHESYWFEDSSVFIRFWFAMADSYLGGHPNARTLAETWPHLLFNDDPASADPAWH